MKLTEVVNNKEIVIVCGNISSGKGHYIAQHYPDHKHISVSSIVKSLSGFQTRSQLSTTASLDTKIIEKLIEKIDRHDKVVVDGIRQPQILHALEKHYGSNIKDTIWLDVPNETLKSRFAQRGSGKDDLSFDKAVQTDKELGIDDVESHIRKNGRVIKY